MNTKIATWHRSVGGKGALNASSTTALSICDGLGRPGRELSILCAGLASLGAAGVRVGELHGRILIARDEHVADRKGACVRSTRE